MTLILDENVPKKQIGLVYNEAKLKGYDRYID
jgi:hypothetical protein